VGKVVGGRPPTFADLPRLRYAEHVVTESMRLYPPVYAFSREAAEPCELGGYAVPRGMTVMMSQWILHRDPRYFDDPLRFDPSRWEGDLARRLPRFAYFPFGGGPRQCIGSTFSMIEAVLILAAVVRRFRLEPSGPEPVAPRPSITLRPEGPVRLRVQARPV
jgi:cytochrome P450